MTNLNLKVVQYRDDSTQGVHHGLLVSEGHKWAHIVAMDCPICMIKRPVDEGYTETTDDPIKARETFLNAGTRLGITEGALKALGVNHD